MQTHSQPRISVVIPTRNRRDVLLQTLTTLSRQAVPQDSYEVIVVSDGSTDGTPQGVLDLAQSEQWAGSGRSLTCIEQEWSGASAARNLGIHIARGEVVLLLDDDIAANLCLIKAHLAQHVVKQSCVVLGGIVPEQGRGALQRQLRRSFANRHRRLLSEEPLFTDLYTGNVSVPRRDITEAGGLDEKLTYGEDVELGYRLHTRGLSFVYAPDAWGRHRDLKPAPALLRDFYRSGQGCVRIYRKWPGTFNALPFSSYRERTMRMSVVRALLAGSNIPAVQRAVEAAFEAWGDSRAGGRLSHMIFSTARSYYFWRGVRDETQGGPAWRALTL